MARRSIGIFNIDGSFFALRNHCPHQGGPLCLGKIWGSVTSNAPGEFVYRPESEIITCPHHGWDFNIRTGQSWCDPERLRTSTYQVDIENGDDIVKNDTMSIPDENGRVKGPYVVETDSSASRRPISRRGAEVIDRITVQATATHRHRIDLRPTDSGPYRWWSAHRTDAR